MTFCRITISSVVGKLLALAQRMNNSQYITEPATSGKVSNSISLNAVEVLLSTTVGEIEVELWAKEAPLACRNFVQLCMEGYYNGTVFHRLVKDFIIQGGDPTGTGFIFL